MKVFCFFLLRSVQGWFRYGVRFCLGLVWGCVQGRFEIVVKIDLRFSLGGLTVSLKFTVCCWHNAYLTFFSVLLLACLVFGLRCA